MNEAALEIEPDASLEKGLLRGVLRAASRETAALLWITVSTAFSFVLGLGLPAATNLVMDHALLSGARGVLATAAGTLVLLELNRAWLRWLRCTAARHLDAKLQRSAARGVFSHLLALPYLKTQGQGVGVRMQAMRSTEQLVELLTARGLLPLLDATTGFAYALVLVYTAPSVGVLSVLLMTVALLTTVALAQRHARQQQAELTAAARQQERLYELIEGASALKMAGQRTRGVKRWLAAFLEERVTSVRRQRTATWADAVLGLAHDGMSLGLLAWGGALCLAGELSLGSYAAAVLLADSFAAGAVGFGKGLLPLWAARMHTRQVNAWLAHEPLLPSNPTSHPRRPPQQRFAIEVEGLWFRYGERQPWVVRDENLRLAQGAFHALRGPSGTGKTTLLRIIAGLLPASRGSVSVLGLRPDDAREWLAYLPQEAHLFEGSILANLSLLSSAPLTRIEAACQATGLTEWLTRLPMGLDTALPPGARNLSGGERQWIVLTAAIASQRPVLLLDEALSHMDRLLRARLLSSPIFAGRTVLSVTHDTE